MHLETIMFTWEIGPTKEKPLYKRSLSIHCSITHLDFICIHWSVCNEDLCIFYSFWLIYTNLLVKQKSCYESEKGEFLFSKTFDSFKKSSSVIKIGMLLTTITTDYYNDYYIPSSKYESTRFPPSFLMIWMASKFPLPWNFEKNQTSVYIKPYVSNVITNQWTLTRNPRQIINNYLIMTNQFTTVPVQVNYACHSIYFTSINYEIWQVTTVTIDIWHPYNLVSPGKNH